MKQLSDSRSAINGMKVLTKYRNIRPARYLDFLIEETIGTLNEMITVESAEVTVERSMTDRPPFKVQINVETPGPDISVLARDYTSAAAYKKAWKQLQKRAEWKVEKAERPKRRSPHPGRPSNQRVGI